MGLFPKLSRQLPTLCWKHQQAAGTSSAAMASWRAVRLSSSFVKTIYLLAKICGRGTCMVQSRESRGFPSTTVVRSSRLRTARRGTTSLFLVSSWKGSMMGSFSTSASTWSFSAPTLTSVGGVSQWGSLLMSLSSSSSGFSGLFSFLIPGIESAMMCQSSLLSSSEGLLIKIINTFINCYHFMNLDLLSSCLLFVDHSGLCIFRSQILSMNLIECKALFLKTRSKQARFEAKTINKIEDLYSHTLDPPPTQQKEPSHRRFTRKGFSLDIQDSSNMLREEKNVLLRVVNTKMSSAPRGRRKTLSLSENRLTVTKSKLCRSESVELQLNKPTDRHFHQLQNIRIAENILFARPTAGVVRSSLASFFRRQSQYKKNICRMPPKLRRPKKGTKEWAD